MLSLCELKRAARIVDARFGDALVEKIVDGFLRKVEPVITCES